MTGGMAGIAGTVLVLYAQFLAPVVPDAAGHFIIASVLGAPAAILISQVMVPDAGDTRTDAALAEPEPVAASSMDAIVKGTVRRARAVAEHHRHADRVRGAGASRQRDPRPPARHRRRAGHACSAMLGLVMAPVCWLIGIPWDQAATAGTLMGIKTILNEFIAYLSMPQLPAGALSTSARG